MPNLVLCSHGTRSASAMCRTVHLHPRLPRADCGSGLAAARALLMRRQAVQCGLQLRSAVSWSAGVAPLAGLSAAVAAVAAASSRRGGRRGRTALAAKKKRKGGGKEEGAYTTTVLVPKTPFSQRANAKKREPELQDFWRKQQIYERMQEQPAPRGPFVLHDGPPYANGSLHMGHALNKILKDIINKFQAARGHQVKYIPGWDCHGLPIELKVVQSLKSSERKDLTPVKLRSIAGKFARETVEVQRQSFERFGVWGDFDEPYLTLLPQYEAAQLAVFEEMLRGGHIYRGFKPVFWSPSTRTALAEAELEYPDAHTSPSIYVGFKCTEAPEAFQELAEVAGLEVAIWTTTPWTIPANRAVAVNPELKYVVAHVTWPDKDEESEGSNEAHAPRRLVVAEGLLEPLEDMFGASLSVEARFKGQALEGLQYEHPLTGAINPVVVGGNYITTDSGTGLVHTAPGHGADDYIVGMKYGLEVSAPVDDSGNFTADVGVEELVGANVLKDANEKVTQLLSDNGRLLHRYAYVHKYPYDWRSKKPVITRATPQWFASIDNLRDNVLDAVEKVKFIPDTGLKRMRPMIVNRNDWCISRQRSWGVPIPAFYRKDNGEPLLTPEVVAHVRGIVAEQGSDAWWKLSEEELLPDELKADAELYRKGTETMDVWFDSGSSWAAVKEQLGTPVDLYLEGTDQYRGWFQSSLITSVAVSGEAPYKAVITHGFCVDGDGRKMSKSIGNVIDPLVMVEGGADQKRQPSYGADVLRLWAATVDFFSDVPISDTIMARTADSSRKIRNTMRYLLGNIADFDPAAHAVPYKDLPLMDKHIIREAETCVDNVEEAFAAYSFSRGVGTYLGLVQDLSQFYLDAVKDRLYYSEQDSFRRRSCQTVLHWLVINLSRAIAPVLSHLAEDVWQSMDHEETSIFLTGWAQRFPGSDLASEDKELTEELDAVKRVLELSESANAALEQCRRSQLIGAGLEAQLRLCVRESSPLRASLERLNFLDGDEAKQLEFPDIDGLRWLFKVSQAEATIVGDDDTLDVADNERAVEDEELRVLVVASPARGEKCERCWSYHEVLGEDEAHPRLCSRCTDVVKQLDFELAEDKSPVAEAA